MLQWVALDGTVQFGHVEVQSVQRGGLPSAYEVATQLAGPASPHSALPIVLVTGEGSLNTRCHLLQQERAPTNTSPGTKEFGLISALQAQL